MEGTIGVFVTAKPVVGMNENSKNSLKALSLGLSQILCNRQKRCK